MRSWLPLLLLCVACAPESAIDDLPDEAVESDDDALSDVPLRFDVAFAERLSNHHGRNVIIAAPFPTPGHQSDSSSTRGTAAGDLGFAGFISHSWAGNQHGET
jgi:hypothetical protein